MTVHSITGGKLYAAEPTVVCTGAGEVNVLDVLSHVAHVVGHLAAESTGDDPFVGVSGNVLVKFIQLA